MASGKLLALAAGTLAPVIAQSQSLNVHFDSAIGKLDLRERALFQQLCYGTLRHFHALATLSAPLLDKPLRNKDSDIFALLLLGLYQLKYLRTPDHAAISETVAATRVLKKPWASGLLNGLLRSYQRQHEALENQAIDVEEYRFNHPQWLIHQIQKAWPNSYAAILAANNEEAPLCLRVNTRFCTRDNYLVLLEKENIQAEILPCATGLRLLKPLDVRLLPHFSEGWVSVQDEAAQYAAELLNAQPGERILDACAAPGGKSCHILERQAELDELVCVELDAKRMLRVEENMRRLQLQATLKIADVAQLEQWWDGKLFDRILLDAPCSATGVIRRHPDIKLLRRENDIPALAAIQLSLLDVLWRTLKPGGYLLYATCSVLPDENAMIIQKFLSDHSEAKTLPTNIEAGLAGHFGLQLLPEKNGHDGFFYSLLQKY